MPTKQQTKLSIANFYRHPVASGFNGTIIHHCFYYCFGCCSNPTNATNHVQTLQRNHRQNNPRQKLQDKIASLNTAQAEYYRWQEKILCLIQLFLTTHLLLMTSNFSRKPQLSRMSS